MSLPYLYNSTTREPFPRGFLEFLRPRITHLSVFLAQEPRRTFIRRVFQNEPL